MPLAMARGRVARERAEEIGGEDLPRDARRKLVARYELDLVGFLNNSRLTELKALCRALNLDEGGGLGALRLRLWRWGAGHERRGIVATVDAHVQRPPDLVGARLVVGGRKKLAAAGSALPAAREAQWPGSPRWPDGPIEVPPAASAVEPSVEPGTLDELLARADALVGVRLGSRGADKGAYGHRIAALLGIPRSSAADPDWRGEVEVKTLAVVRAAGARWRLKDGPAIGMRSVDASAKARRVLWIVRADEGEVPGAPVLSWFYQELAGEVLEAFEAARHLRPKGGAGTQGKGWYLRRPFFEACGLMASINGPS